MVLKTFFASERLTKSNIFNDPLNVLAMYSSGKYKGVDDLIEAFKIAKNKNPKLNFNLYGKEKKPNNLPKWINYHRRISENNLVNLMPKRL